MSVHNNLAAPLCMCCLFRKWSGSSINQKYARLTGQSTVTGQNAGNQLILVYGQSTGAALVKGPGGFSSNSCNVVAVGFIRVSLHHSSMRDNEHCRGFYD